MERLVELNYKITKLDAKIDNMTDRIEKMGLHSTEEVGLQFLVSTVKHFKELREYLIAEKQGLLLQLPCKAGDIVYAIDGRNIQTLKAKNDIALISGELCIFAENCHYADYINYDMLGKTVFLTQQEAEQKLKEMEGE
ncbi:MAG: hypothetical protein ACI4DU_03455 [Lachnospiraceae bacterium]